MNTSCASLSLTHTYGKSIKFRDYSSSFHRIFSYRSIENWFVYKSELLVRFDYFAELEVGKWFYRIVNEGNSNESKGRLLVTTVVANAAAAIHDEQSCRLHILHTLYHHVDNSSCVNVECKHIMQSTHQALFCTHSLSLTPSRRVFPFYHIQCLLVFHYYSCRKEQCSNISVHMFRTIQCLNGTSSHLEYLYIYICADGYTVCKQYFRSTCKYLQGKHAGKNHANVYGNAVYFLHHPFCSILSVISKLC